MSSPTGWRLTPSRLLYAPAMGNKRIRSVLLAAAVGTVVVAGSGTSNALVAPRGEDRVVANNERDTPRAHRSMQWSRGASLPGLPGWTAMIDRDTGVPTRMWGPSASTPGAMTNPAVAESAARS